MRILGIDPGTIITGYGIIEERNGQVHHVDNGGIQPRKKLPLPQRLQTIATELARIIERFQPEAVAVESLFVARNVRSSLLLGHARGVALLAAANAGLPVAEYSPTEVKQAVTGTGRASKAQIQHMVRAMLRLPEEAFEDASDALAVAMCHGQCAPLQKRIADSVERLAGRKP